MFQDLNYLHKQKSKLAQMKKFFFTILGTTFSCKNFDSSRLESTGLLNIVLEDNNQEVLNFFSALGDSNNEMSIAEENGFDSKFTGHKVSIIDIKEDSITITFLIVSK